MNAQKLLEKRQKLKMIDAGIRGEYLLTIAYLEQRIDQILADFYCTNQEKRNLLLEKVLRSKDMTFSNKIQILENIVKSKFPSYYDDRKQIFKTINELREFRNKLAHQPPELKISEVAKRKEDEIVLLTLVNGKEKPHVHKIRDIRKKIGIATALLVSDLSNLHKLVKIE